MSKTEDAARDAREERPADGAGTQAQPAGEVDPDGQRKKLVWESALGFVGFFTLLAGVQAVWNVFQPEPSPWPGVFFAILLLLSWLVWRGYRRYREY